MKISIHQLSKRFGHHTAIHIPHLDITDGEVVGLVGNNGAGKTTLFRLMLDLLRPDCGDVEMTFHSHVNGQADTLTLNPAQREDWKRYTGAFLDESFLIDFLTPNEYFDFIASISNLTHETMVKRLLPFKYFMLDDPWEQQKLIRDFSAGNRQKIGIIAAMLNRPQLLVLDEPFNYLDPTGQTQLGMILHEYSRQTGATLLISSHNLQYTLSLASRIVLLEDGCIVKDLRNVNGSALSELEQYFNQYGTSSNQAPVF